MLTWSMISTVDLISSIFLMAQFHEAVHGVTPSLEFVADQTIGEAHKAALSALDDQPSMMVQLV